MKCYHLYVICLLYTWTCSSCGYLHKTKPVKNSRKVRVRATEAPLLAVEVLYLELQESLFFGGWQLAVGSLHMSQWMTHTMCIWVLLMRLTELTLKKKLGGWCIGRWFCPLRVGWKKGANKIKVHYKHAWNLQRIDRNTIFLETETTSRKKHIWQVWCKTAD